MWILLDESGEAGPECGGPKLQNPQQAGQRIKWHSSIFSQPQRQASNDPNIHTYQVRTKTDLPANFIATLLKTK